jgi:L-malate glycosyltransferase
LLLNANISTAASQPWHPELNALSPRARQEKQPRLAILGPMVGRNKGLTTHQGEILADLFESADYRVTSASAEPNRYLRFADIIRSLVKHRRQIDIVLLQVYGERSFVVEDTASCLADRLGLGIIMALHGGSLPTFITRHPNWTRRVLRRAHAVVTPTEYLARAVATCGLQAHVIPNVINLAAYPFRHRHLLSPRLFWMRAFDTYYNPVLCLRVLRELRATHPNATLVMAGYDAGLRDAVQREARALNLENAVRFPGFLDPRAKVREGEAADIFLNTSRVDNMPVALVEACAMGLPVVTTNVGGIPDLLTNEETGLLVRNEDLHGMVAAVRRLLTEPGLAARLSSNGRKLAERSDWSRVRPQWESVFGQIKRATVG